MDKMSEIYIFVDKNKPGSEELMEDLYVELSALEIGGLEKITETPEEGTLPGIDLETVIIILTLAKVSLDFIRSIIKLIEEVRLRYADRKNIELKDVPKIAINKPEETSIDESKEIEIPSSKKAEKIFIEEVIDEEESGD